MFVVTGASGLVGGNLVRALLAEGRAVRAVVHRDRRALEGLSVEVVSGDVRDPVSLRRAFAGAEMVYHLAASISLEMGNWAELEAVNVQGTRNVVEACLGCGVGRLVHFSSIHALQQKPLDQLLDETRPPADSPDLPPYDRSKAAADREVRAGLERGLDAVILYPTAMLGPYDYKPSFLGGAVRLLARGWIPALVEGGFDWVDVRDVAAGALAAGRLAPRGAAYLLGGHWHSVREVAEMVARFTGRPAPFLTAPTWLAAAAAPAMVGLARLARQQPIYTRATLLALDSNHNVSSARAEAELGYRARPFAETVADTIAWFQAVGMLPGGRQR